jgi:hypothetical protein
LELVIIIISSIIMVVYYKNNLLKPLYGIFTSTRNKHFFKFHNVATILWLDIIVQAMLLPLITFVLVLSAACICQFSVVP